MREERAIRDTSSASLHHCHGASAVPDSHAPINSTLRPTARQAMTSRAGPINSIIKMRGQSTLHLHLHAIYATINGHSDSKNTLEACSHLLIIFVNDIHQ
jgi:hypothetical protein